MTVIKKLLFLTLSVALVLTACAPSAEETVPEYESADSETADFEGTEYVIAQEQNSFPGSIYYYEKDSLYYDLLMAHVDKIEKTHNLKLSFVTNMGNDSTFYNLLFAELASSLRTHDFVLMRESNRNMTAARAGMFYPLNYFPDVIDLHDHDKYGPINILECCMANGNIYGVIPNYWPLRCNDGNLSVFVTINENIIARYGLVDPRDIYEQNEWKLSRFEEIMPAYHVGDSANDIKALGMNKGYVSRGFYGAYHIGNVYEKDGEYLSAEYNPDLIEAIEWGVNFLNNRKDDIVEFDGWDFSDHMANGECTMAFSESSYLLNLANKLENFGLVPFPSADKYDCKDVQMGFSTYPTLSIFSIANDADACARVIDILFEEIDGASKEDMVDFLFKTMFFDERDARLYTEQYKNGVYDYYGIGGNVALKVEGLYTTKTAQEIISSLEGTMDEFFEETILPNYNTIRYYE